MVATVLVKRGVLKTGSVIIAGQAHAKVRQMTDDKGKVVKEVLPGFPVTVTGWRELPDAGDEVLEVLPVGKNNAEALAKRAIGNRKRIDEIEAMVSDVDRLNAISTEAHEVAKERYDLRRSRRAARMAYKLGQGPQPERYEPEKGKAGFEQKMTEEEKMGIKVLNLVVKGDVSGTVEAVTETLAGIGNKDVHTKIVHAGVGDITSGDVEIAQTTGGELACMLSIH
jgi:translation initiation factor IF-2